MTHFRHLVLLVPGLAFSFACSDEGPRVGGAFFDGSVEDAASAPDASTPSCGAEDRVGEACESSAECDDGCYCNGLEVCMGGTCQRLEAPCDDGVECTTDSCIEEERRCEWEGDHEVCQDGNLCNGAEVCAPGVGCTAGPRLSCVDGDPCTIGSCDPTGGCTYTIRDLDGDGFQDMRCGGDDCNDDPIIGGTVQPGAIEICDNGIDDDCNRLVDYREPQCLASNDTCATREALAVPGSWVRTTRGAANQYPIGCFGSGIDTVFEFTLTEAADIAAFVRAETGSAAVAIRAASQCANGTELACGSEAVGRALAPGDYVAIVRTSQPTSFDLQIELDSASTVGDNDVCSGTATDIAVGGTFSGLFADVADDYSLPCRLSGSTREAAYRLVLTETSDVTLRGSVSGGSATASAFLSLTRDCNGIASLGCVQSRPAELHRRSLPAGTYYVLLESSDSSSLAWTLEATVTPAAPRAEGDACITSTDITNTSLSLPIDTLELDSGTSCGGATSVSRDASFYYTVTTTSDVTLTTEVGATHFVSVGSTCGDLSSETFCTNGTPRVEKRFLRVAPGTYHVTVSTALSTGLVTATAMLSPPTFPPANDDCTAPADLTDGMIFAGDLTAAGDDFVSCAGSGKAETVHRLVLTERKNVSLIARRAGGAGEPLYLGLRRATNCDGDGADLLCTSGAPAFLNRTLDAGTYYVVVESATVLSPYTLALYLADP